ncbi:tryptophan--tRNA ligase [Mycoplasma sp. P36-A1]|uniref:tryptophan--tRNA ligase n=1 Tax=Mycoplasma sp. P36-A1 TaxID=3252900 RepID=UPI003C2B229C
MERALSGIQSSGKLTLGNYIGALKQFVKLQDEFEMYVFVANLHAITVPQVKKELQENTINLVAFYLASGLDTSKSTIFLQSDVFAHAQLGWIMQCHTYMGELSRMTQFKDKSSKYENVGAGLFAYPSLMAADILLYDPVFVPVGEDQTQHIELARTLAERFNNKYGDTFTVPQIKLVKEGTRVMSLSDPTRKMSKSDPAGDKSCIYLLDDEKTIIKKIKSATTDSVAKVNYDPENQPGISNLLTIYAAMKDISAKEALAIFKDYNYADFKSAVAQAVVDELIPLQERYHAVLENNLVEEALLKGAEHANKVGFKKVMKVQDRIGLNLKKKKK